MTKETKKTDQGEFAANYTLTENEDGQDNQAEGYGR